MSLSHLICEGLHSHAAKFAEAAVEDHDLAGQKATAPAQII
jgi:hypothetical protein